MQMLYNSDSYTVVLFDAAAPDATGGVGDAQDRAALPRLGHGGYEIVDKFARKEIFIQGVMAQSFKEGVEALIETRPSEEEIDDYLEGFASLMHQSLVLH
ncbi:MAG: DUF3567 domain-containing protein [Burkholderiaceae bacterium]